MLYIRSVQIKKNNLISETGLSQIYMAEWNIPARSPVPAVMKVEKIPGVCPDEADLLTKARHPKVVELYGQVFLGSDKGALVFELMTDDLESYLKKNNQPGSAMNPVRHTIAIDILEALAYLHFIDIIHRDIKCANFLLSISSTGEIIAKIADFGLARKRNPSINGYLSYFTTPSGTKGYIAPEIYSCFNDKKAIFTTKSDMYGMGMVLLSLGSDDMPSIYPGKDDDTIERYNKSTKMPEIHNEVSQFTREMFLLCFKTDPNDRADAKTVLRHYKNMKGDVSNSGYRSRQLAIG